MAQSARTSEVFVLHVTLEEVLPPIWRRVAVPSEATFHRLHEILQAVSGYENHHLYEFEVGVETIALPDLEEPGERSRDSRFVKLRDTLTAGDHFLYRYDFGDDWLHIVKVERRMPADPSAIYPLCLAGERSGPPEDSGGVDGYLEILGVLADPKHPEYAATKRWVGKDFDPERFDLKEVNALLRSFNSSRRAPRRR